MNRVIYAVVAAALCSPLPAHAEGFQTTDNCLETLQGISDTDSVLLGAWVMGYLDKTNESVSLVRVDNAMVILRNMSSICAKRPDASILDIVQANQKNTPDTTGTKAHAVEFLNQFMAADADRVALTASMKPGEADIRAVYKSPLADALIPMYNDMFQPGVAIGPKEDQKEILIWRGTTDSLRRGDPVLEDFPGGYGEVRQYMQGDYPIVRFKFVKPGETLGLAFDGLIHVNGRWVLMPKPWRALDN